MVWKNPCFAFLRFFVLLCFITGSVSKTWHYLTFNDVLYVWIISSFLISFLFLETLDTFFSFRNF